MTHLRLICAHLRLKNPLSPRTPDTKPLIERSIPYRRSSHDQQKRREYPARRIRWSPKTENIAPGRSNPVPGRTHTIKPQIRKTV